jgi:hypothetical protein
VEYDLCVTAGKVRAVLVNLSGLQLCLVNR